MSKMRIVVDATKRRPRRVRVQLKRSNRTTNEDRQQVRATERVFKVGPFLFFFCKPVISIEANISFSVLSASPSRVLSSSPPNYLLTLSVSLVFPLPLDRPPLPLRSLFCCTYLLVTSAPPCLPSAALWSPQPLVLRISISLFFALGETRT